MFLGESLCLVAFFAINWNHRRTGNADKIEHADPSLPWYVLAAPATCDLLGTSLMYLGQQTHSHGERTAVTGMRSTPAGPPSLPRVRRDER